MFHFSHCGCMKMRIRITILQLHGLSEEHGKHIEGTRFRVGGIEIPECRGRAATLLRVRNELVNNQVSIVGPRHGGKTVLMHHLATKVGEDGGQFAGSVLWNLKEKK